MIGVKSQQKGDKFSSLLKASSPGVEMTKTPVRRHQADDRKRQLQRSPGERSFDRSRF